MTRTRPAREGPTTPDPTREYYLDLVPGQATWVPAGVPHRFLNRGEDVMRIYWVYGGRKVTRTISATGETVEHLSAHDTGGTAGDRAGA